MTLHEAAPAKINLFLHVVGRRADGYHLLDSLAVFAGAADRLSAVADDGISLAIGGPFAAGLAADADNLVLRAAQALRAAAGGAGGARLMLEKTLPVASGIGGGSADAAAALRLLNRLWGVGASAAALAGVGLALGADVPVCLAAQPARMTGVGEVLQPGARAAAILGLVLVNPGVAVATEAVFRARAGGFSAPAALPAGWADAAAMAADLAALRNDLEAPARALCPAVGEVLAALRGAGVRLARMSGSGATCFGVVDSPAEAAALAAGLARPGWWVWGGGVFAERAVQAV